MSATITFVSATTSGHYLNSLGSPPHMPSTTSVSATRGQGPVPPVPLATAEGAPPLAASEGRRLSPSLLVPVNTAGQDDVSYNAHAYGMHTN